jgi:hypothetical protein
MKATFFVCKTQFKSYGTKKGKIIWLYTGFKNHRLNETTSLLELEDTWTPEI